MKHEIGDASTKTLGTKWRDVEKRAGWQRLRKRSVNSQAPKRRIKNHGENSPGSGGDGPKSTPGDISTPGKPALTVRREAEISMTIEEDGHEQSQPAKWDGESRGREGRTNTHDSTEIARKSGTTADRGLFPIVLR